MIFCVLMGSSWRDPDGNLNVPYLYENDNERNLNLNWFENDFNSNCRFLVVSKSIYFPVF